MERRESERFPVRQFRREDPLYPETSCRILNISKSGCAVESDQALVKRNGVVELDLPLPSRADSMTLSAKVVWEEEQSGGGGGASYLYGLCFEVMDNVSNLILEAYLDFLKRDVHIAQLEEAWDKLKRVQERLEVMLACEEKKKASFLH